MGRIVFDIERCKGCGYCVQACPRGLIVINNTYNRKGYPVASFKKKDDRDCRACKLCAEVCPDVAIEVYSNSR
ncbi:MAG: ferredoxin family protein [Dethiobacteria bacterium]